ncbi:MAG: DUF4981 domain-containing protein [Clostridiales bacterium]|jgi:beta-galactosidase/beta-glucuronidase|nr:DUF4981 domain-containing protein [Clostridiales bacterium]
MKYKIDKTNYKTFEVFEQNKLPPRAYFIPFPSKEDSDKTDFMTERYNSPRVTVLSGDWKFKYYGRASLMPDIIRTGADAAGVNVGTAASDDTDANADISANSETSDTDANAAAGADRNKAYTDAKVDTDTDANAADLADFDDIKVPSCWQRTGYEPPVYLNVRYPFDLNPPHFPEDCPVGVYFRTFGVSEKADKHYILTFLGVSSCVSVYVNGNFAGYSEGSHNSAEFDISGFLNEGENELLAVVYKWCNGTYLEDQDMFRENGIFRDVFITEYNGLYVYDYFADTEKNKDGAYNLTIKAKLGGAPDTGFSCRNFVFRAALYYKGGIVAEDETGVTDASPSVTLSNLDVAEWSAEIPEIYELFIYLERRGEPEALKIEDAENTAAENGGNYGAGNSEDAENNAENNAETTENGGVANAENNAGNTADGGHANVGNNAGNGAEITENGDSANSKNNAESAENTDAGNGGAGETKIYDVIRNYTGFKNIEIEGSVFKLNGKKIKIKGVNHHDSTPHGGYVMTPNELKRDVLIMKEYNVNGVRTSHYPKDPIFLTLCDVYGLYVIDEADIETHGCIYSKKSGIFNKMKGMNLISDDPKWERHYADRVKRLYYKDRNHPSVVMWSLGNEAGGIANQDACYKMLKDEGAKAPVHYEGARHILKRLRYDVMSTMYPFMFHVKNVVRGTSLPMFRKAPYFFCEYAHAMGFGPGNLKEYVEAFYACDTLMGGCIWEFADHAVLHADGEKYKYTYGGDHGEKLHDGNFCVDGLFYPDRAPHTGALNMKAVYRPLIIKKADGGGAYVIENRNRFLSSGYIEVAWRLLKNGEEIGRGVIDEDVPPEESRQITVPHRKIDKNYDYHINFVCRDRRGGHIISEEQIELNRAKNIFKSDETVYKAEIVEDAGALTVKFKGGSVSFDKKSGYMTGLKYKEREYLNLNPENGITGFYPSVYRAPLDNDNLIRKLYEKLGTADLSLRLKKISAKLVGGDRAKAKDAKKKVEVKIFYGLDGKYKLYGANVKYLIDGKGKITVTARLKVTALICQIYKRMALVPRFGLEVELDGRYDNVEYFGLGSRETLPDMKDHASVGIYKQNVGALREKYIKPQDSGNRSEVGYLKICDEKDNGLIFKRVGENFNFTANRFTTKQLAEAKHQEDLVEKNTVDLRIDGFVRGTGSNSCGPLPLKKYTIDMNGPLVFSFSIEPLSSK